MRFKLVMATMFMFGLLSAWAAPSAQALGAKIYRTDNQGNETSTVFKVGSTGPECCCVWHGEGEVNLGVRVCYLPIP